MDPLAQARALRLHLLEQLSLYALKQAGDQSPNVADIVFVNLVDKKSDQGRLGKAFDSVLNAVMDVYTVKSLNTTAEASKTFKPNSVQHIWYDFHAEVKQGRWDRLSLLLDEVEPSLLSHGYFQAKAPSDEGAVNDDWKVERLQNAIVRTNCMDCLDRTNVVQSIFGRYILFQQLCSEAEESFKASPPTHQCNKKLWTGLNTTFHKNSLTLPWKNGEISHRLLWADNADSISRLYAGTPALKGDFTRTGKRTKRGALDDGMNSLQRYYLNNFLDADRQEGYDLLVGYAAFSNVGEIPLEIEELVYLEEEDKEQNTDGKNAGIDDATARARRSMSLYEAAREKMMSGVVDSSRSQNRKYIRNRLQDIGIPKKEHATVEDDLGASLDLRWLPGDLQTHLRSQAEGTASSLDVDPEESSSSPEDPAARKNGFDFQKALRIIDERSTQVLPWWAESLESEDSDEEVIGSLSFEHGVDLPQRDQRNHALATNSLLLTFVLILGAKSPLFLALMCFTLLSFVYLPEVLESDFRQGRAWLQALLSKLQQGSTREEDE
ncbi:MAG: hypothetical protein SGILL_010681 [Bacillariaceae sp.]